jgi:tetratricopeptide (TPR) repeat protein
MTVAAVAAEIKTTVVHINPEGETIGQTQTNVNEERWRAQLEKGRDVLQAGDAAAAVKEYIDPVITYYEKTYADSPNEIFCADDQHVTLFYLLSAAISAEIGKEKIPENLAPEIFKATGRDTRKSTGDTIVLSSTWAEAYFLKAYALVEQKKIKSAQEYLEKALRLSPCKATYWSELGHVHQVQKDWDGCLEAFQLAEEASEFSADENKDFDRARAWRGIGFVYIETDKLDEAEALYNMCLELNADDKMAANELRYIEQLRAK